MSHIRQSCYNVAVLGEKTQHMLEEAERMGLDALVQVRA